MVEKANYLIVPGGLFESFENFDVFALLIVVDDYGLEVFLDGFDERRVGEDFGPKDLAASSSWDFLKEKEDWLTASLGRDEGFF